MERCATPGTGRQQGLSQGCFTNHRRVHVGPLQSPAHTRLSLCHHGQSSVLGLYIKRSWRSEGRKNGTAKDLGGEDNVLYCGG